MEEVEKTAPFTDMVIVTVLTKKRPYQHYSFQKQYIYIYI